jgi:hypothetical protein
MSESKVLEDLTLLINKSNVPDYDELMEYDLDVLEIMKSETFQTWEKLGVVIALKKGD